MFAKVKQALAARFQAGWRHVTFDDATRSEVEEAGADSPPALRTDSRSAARWGVIALVVGFGGFVVWAAFAPLDEGVPAPGVVSVESKRKAVQHLRGGIVRKIHVQEGSRVRAGDVLISLDDVEARSQLDIVQAQWWTALAQEARLLAEQAGAASVRFPPELTTSTDARAQEAMRIQQGLFQTRREALTSQTRILGENLKGLKEQMAGLQALQAGKQRQIELLETELSSMRELAQEGFLPQVRLMEIERMLAELSGSRANDLANIARARNAMSEIELRMVAIRQEFQQEVQQRLSEVQKEVENLRDRLVALREELNRLELRAPVDGTVVGLNVFTVGGVIQPGQTLMEIVPEDESLLIEVHIPTNLIEKVHPGLTADIRFATVKGAMIPPISGTLVTVSADRLLDPQSGMPYFLGRVQVTAEGLETLRRSQHSIHPGMPADVVIKTGERTLLQYLISPLTTRIASALKEI